MINFKIILLVFFNTLIYASSLSINESTKFYDLLPSSQIYIDKSKDLTIKDIQKDNIVFKDNNKKLLGFGYSPDFNVWIKFTLKNSTNKPIEKIIEYDNALTTHIEFFDISLNKVYKEGLFNINPNRKTLKPIFKIKLQKNESKVYYIKVSSYITTLITKLNIWDSDSFYEKEIQHQLVLALFFGAMFILGVYNLFIYFFTKDVSYLYYVLYIVGITFHHLIYVGMSGIYILPQSWSIYVIEYGSLIVVFPALALGFFTKSFLQTKQYPKINLILNLSLILIPAIVIYLLIIEDFSKYRNLFSFSLLVLLMIITLYAAIKRNRQAYFILFGWLIFLTAGMFMYLSSMGVFNIYEISPYYVEISLVVEAIIFSIALADKIKQLQHTVIIQQQNEKERLEIKVNEKTKDLKVALDEKGLLLKELNHRVKNNMQTIVSLLRLQGDEIDDERLQDIFLTVQNRINAMSHLHELLYSQDNISHINAYEYFDILIDELKDSYESDVNINLDIKTDLKMEQAIYCGLILNELITNSFKYAFVNKKGNINISLEKQDNTYKLSISDDGKGYDKNIPTNSLGLILVNTLAEKQLKGDIKIDSSNGVKVDITWSNNE